jgi:hypothetical protein
LYVFEEAYSNIYNGMDFGKALYMMKRGHKVARNGWNGKDMYISITEGHKGLEEEKCWNPNVRKTAKENSGAVDILPYILMKTANNKICIGWLASQTDLLENDWYVVE